jgi:hypothetical protein
MARSPKKRRRESSFSDVDEFGYVTVGGQGHSINKTVEKNKGINRAEQVRRDDDIIKSFEITLQTIDTAFLKFIEDTIKPSVEENGNRLPVPIMYASPEKWSSIQSHGYLRDKKGKILIPLITFRRTDIADRDGLAHNKVIFGPDNKIQFEKVYSKQNRYDKFSILQGRKPVKERYEINLPDYIDVTYEMTCWAEYTSQVNKLVEDMVFWSGRAWGDTYKFITKANSYSFETTNITGEDRVNRASIGFTVQAHLIPKDYGTQNNMKKSYTKAQLVIKESTVSDINKISSS